MSLIHSYRGSLAQNYVRQVARSISLELTGLERLLDSLRSVEDADERELLRSLIEPILPLFRALLESLPEETSP